MSSGFFFNYKGTKSKEGALISHQDDLFMTEAMSGKINLLKMFPKGLQILAIYKSYYNSRKETIHCISNNSF